MRALLYANSLIVPRSRSTIIITIGLLVRKSKFDNRAIIIAIKSVKRTRRNTKVFSRAFQTSFNNLQASRSTLFATEFTAQFLSPAACFKRCRDSPSSSAAQTPRSKILLPRSIIIKLVFSASHAILSSRTTTCYERADFVELFFISHLCVA